MTGEYAWNQGLLSDRNYEKAGTILNPASEILSDFLSNQGYRTSFIGTWGLGFCDESMKPENRGFDSFFGSFDKIDGFSLERDQARDFTDFNQKPNNTFVNELYGDKAIQFIQSQSENEDPFYLHLRKIFCIFQANLD